MSSINSTAPTTSLMPLSSDPKLNEIMTEIEKKTEQKLSELMHPVANKNPLEKVAFVATQSSTTDFGDKLVSIMSQGADEFQAKTGRPMTYSEMRAMYG
jgi:hypothetical protein